jgi:hypothetical protein
MEGPDDAEGNTREEDVESNAESSVSQSISSSLAEEEDSLIDATPAEVEARALALIANNPAVKATDTSTSYYIPIDPLDDLPRKFPPGTAPAKDLIDSNTASSEPMQAAQASAIAFLRQCLEKADETDWMYTTPAVFAAPKLLNAERRGGGLAAAAASSAFDDDLEEGAVGYDGGLGSTVGWLDKAVNLDAYGIEDLSMQETHEEEDDIALESTEHSMFTDMGAASF